MLNGSVDGRGTKSFMVLEGQFVFADRQLWQVSAGAAAAPPVVEAATRSDIEQATRPMYQLSFDGITLVTVENGQARHTIRDLSKQNAGSQSPLDRPMAPGEDAAKAMLRNVEDCYRDGESLRNLHVRPNQVLLTNANRADVFFKAPAGCGRQGLHDSCAGVPPAHRQLPSAAPESGSPEAAAGSRTGILRPSTS